MDWMDNRIINEPWYNCIQNKVDGQIRVSEEIKMDWLKQKESNKIHRISEKKSTIWRTPQTLGIISLLRTFTNIGYNSRDFEIKPSNFGSLQEVLLKLAFAYIKFVDRPHAFDNIDQLIEVDQLHNELFVKFEHTHRYLLETDNRNYNGLGVNFRYT